jgi:hypothetical protein
MHADQGLATLLVQHERLIPTRDEPFVILKPVYLYRANVQ